MIFCRTTYLWAVEWEHFQRFQPRKGKQAWIRHRTRWGDIDGASAFFHKKKNAAPEQYIRNVKLIRRPVGRVETYIS